MCGANFTEDIVTHFAAQNANGLVECFALVNNAMAHNEIGGHNAMCTHNDGCTYVVEQHTYRPVAAFVDLYEYIGSVYAA